MDRTGISIVVCCHNSAGRISQTIKHIARQNPAEGFDWEVLLVDNASSDNTAGKAMEVWEKHHSGPATIRIVPEQRLGIGFARYTGIQSSSYEYIIFVDDDNWLAPDYLNTAYRFMESHPAVAACGSLNSAVSDTEFPWWFEEFQRCFAVGPQYSEAGDVTWKTGVLWSAGIVLRKSALDDLLNSGFEPMVSGARGEKKLLRGEDYELCLALRLRGWRLWYEPGLGLQHYMENNRLEWKYLRTLWKGLGESDPGLIPYFYNMDVKNKSFNRFWLENLIRYALKILKRAKYMIFMNNRDFEGHIDMLMVDRSMSCLGALFADRSEFKSLFFRIKNSTWITVPHGE